MHRYLLLDSGCSQCTEIAQAVEQATQGGLEARSLRDPTMQRLLAQARPRWRWQPALLEVAGDRVRAFTGLAMGLRLAMTLGPHRALQLIKLLGRFSPSLKGMEAADLGRRRFLEQLAALVLVLGWPRSRLFKGALTQPAGRASVSFSPLSTDSVSELVTKSMGETDGKILHEFLSSRGFQLQPNLIEGLQVKSDRLNAHLLIVGYDGIPSGASLIFLTGTSQDQEDSGHHFPIHSWAGWIVDEAIYIVKDKQVVPFPDGTARMQGVPRLPRQPVSGEATGIETHCCPLYYNCWMLNAICVALFVCCALGDPICCASGLAVCLQATAVCASAASCGPPTGC